MQSEFQNWTVANLRKYVATNLQISQKDLMEMMKGYKKEQWVGMAMDIAHERGPLIQVNCIQGGPTNSANPVSAAPVAPTTAPVVLANANTPRRRSPPIKASPRVAAAPAPPTGNDLKAALQRELMLKFKNGAPVLKKAKKESPPKSARGNANRLSVVPAAPPLPPPLPPKNKKK